MDAPIGTLVQKPTVDEVVSALLTADVVRVTFANLPRDLMLADGQRLRASGMTLGDALGAEASHLMLEQAKSPFKPNRELLDQLLDQPLLRQALKNMLQKALQQFIAQLGQIGGSGTAATIGKGVLGSIGRGIAQRAEKAAQIGKTFVEGMGSGLLRQLEEQVQPFLSGFMSRSVRMLSEGLFEGEQQGQLAADARVQGLEILLKTPLDKLLPEPTAERLEQNIAINAAIATRHVSLIGYRDAVSRVVTHIYTRIETMSLREMLNRLKLPMTPTDAFLTSLGETTYRNLARPAMRTMLVAELSVIMKDT